VQNDFALLRVRAQAELYYKQSSMLLPDNGNPHNQLAVMSMYTHHNLAAIHRYWRSLAVRGQPFTLAFRVWCLVASAFLSPASRRVCSCAAQNLKLIFDKNRSKVPKAASNEVALNVYLAVLTLALICSP
jgi:hypothetical protein